MEGFVNHNNLDEIFKSKQIFPKSLSRETKKLVKQIADAKIKLILDLPFFGYLLSQFDIIITDDAKLRKFSISDSFVYFNLNYLMRIQSSNDFERQIRVDLLHLIFHFIFQHLNRLNTRDPNIWSLSSDIIVFQSINELFSERPDYNNLKINLLYTIDETLLNKPTEAVYEQIIRDMAQNEMSKNQSDKQDENRNQEIRERYLGELSTLQCDLRTTIEDSTDEIIQQINLGLLNQIYQEFSKQGNIPAFLENYLKQMFTPKIDWRTNLSIFLQKIIPNDTTWSHPNKRLISNKIYLPSQHKENLCLLIALDTSQSIDESTFSEFTSEVMELTSSLAVVKSIIVQCDMNIQSIKEYEHGEYSQIKIIKGRGGTDFRPVFDLIQKYDCDLVIYFTDGEGIFPKQYNLIKPVLWVLTTSIKPPFGHSIYI